MKFVKYSTVIFQKFKKTYFNTDQQVSPYHNLINCKIFSIINIRYNIVQVTMTYNLCYFLGNKAFVIDFLETGLLCCVCICGLPGKNCPGKINIPHQNPDWPIIPICLVCCCYPSTPLHSHYHIFTFI